MSLNPKSYKSKFGETGSHGESTEYKIVVYPFDKYRIKIKLTPTNEFVEIMEVGINKDFLSHKQKIVSKSSSDVDRFYRK